MKLFQVIKEGEHFGGIFNYCPGNSVVSFYILLPRHCYVAVYRVKNYFSTKPGRKWTVNGYVERFSNANRYSLDVVSFCFVYVRWFGQASRSTSAS